MARWLATIFLCLATCLSAHAGSKILGTGAVSPIEGGAGGGIAPWALITGYGSDGEWGGSVFHTRVEVDDFGLDVSGLAVGWQDRLEVSYARQTLDVQGLSLDIEQDVVAAKYRLAGELLYSRIPQVSLGVQHKKNRDFAVPELLGADDDTGTDVYLAASKLWFAALARRNLLVNAAVRYTQANETGLLGFDDDASVVFEGSAVVFLNDRWVAGVEYRQKPDHLRAVEETDWWHVFTGYFPNKHFSVVLARADLGDIAGFEDQTGWYLSLQGHM